MALETIKAQLDDLMGQDRHLAPEDQREQHWSDANMCKSYLCGFCPHDLFVNTKGDMGACPKKHDDALKDSYRTSHRYKRMGYEWDFLQMIEGLVRDCDRRIRKNESRVATENQKKQGKIVDLMEDSEISSFQEGLDDIDRRIEAKFEEVKSAARFGHMDQALSIFGEAEQIKQERDKFYKTYGPKGPLLEVCKICGSLLAKHSETEERINDHILGRQHMGYAKCRTKIDDLQAQVREGKVRKGEY